MAAHSRAAIRHLAQEAERPPAERFFVGESLTEFKQVTCQCSNPMLTFPPQPGNGKTEMSESAC